MRRIISPALAVLLITVACGEGDEPPATDTRLLVVATTSIIGDVVSATFGAGVEVRVIVSGTQDPHSYRASPEQVASLREADLVVANGLGLEEALTDILEAAAGDGADILHLGELIAPLTVRGAGVVADASNADGPFDPHFWFDPLRMEQAVGLIGDKLAAIDPARARMWRDAAAAYQARLRAVDSDIRDLLAAIPEGDRKLVTSHDSLRYFAAGYGFSIVGTVIPGASTLAEPSASDLADLIEIIRTEEIQAIFVDTTRPARLAEVVAAEVGREISVVELFTGALGPSGTGADTYLGYLQTNAERIVQALAP